MTSKAEYISRIRAGYEREKGHQAEEREKALRSIGASSALFGYSMSRWMLDLGAAGAFLFAQQGDEALVQPAKEALLFYREWLKHLPAGADSLRPEYEEGIPPLDPMFHPVIFIPAVQNLRPVLRSHELEALVAIVADSLRPIWRFPEWGGHNRALLRAASLAMAAQAFPEHAEAAAWASLADELAEESWGRWSIEDAILYQAHWLRALFLYAEARGKEDVKGLIQPRLYLKAVTQLISPLGILPDFGDSHWQMHNTWDWVACLEWGARVYQDPAMKWTANRIWEERQVEAPDLYSAVALMSAWRWCDEAVPEHTPGPTADALDDLIIKKIVFRTGWDRGASYACLNYRDEGDYGRVARDYLRTTLAVSAEKMHHGHADEGSFVMLTHQGSVLLHESGYRESPPDGIYRSAVYHNRLVWRLGQCPAGQDLLPFLRGDGNYHPVRTERLYQTHLGSTEISRVRVTDEENGVVWDRSVFFLPDLPCWVVVDAALSTRSEARTLSALWWTTDVLKQGAGWFETHIHAIQNWENPRNAVLRVHLPAVHGQSGEVRREPFRRSFQDELALTHTWYGQHQMGRVVNFVTVLWPHAWNGDEAAADEAVEVIPSEPAGRGLGVRLRWSGEERWLACLNDLSVGWQQEDIRPRYSTEQGLTTYGPLSSDAAFVIYQRGAQGAFAGMINGTRLGLGEQALFSAQPNAMFQENHTALPGVPARFRWEGWLSRRS